MIAGEGFTHGMLVMGLLGTLTAGMGLGVRGFRTYRRARRERAASVAATTITIQFDATVTHVLRLAQQIQEHPDPGVTAARAVCAYACLADAQARDVVLVVRRPDGSEQEVSFR